MWTLATLVTATVLIPTLAMIGLSRFGKLKRVEDLKTQPQAAEWLRRKSYGRPNRFCLNYGLLQCVSPV